MHVSRPLAVGLRTSCTSTGIAASRVLTMHSHTRACRYQPTSLVPHDLCRSYNDKQQSPGVPSCMDKARWAKHLTGLSLEVEYRPAG